MRWTVENMGYADVPTAYNPDFNAARLAAESFCNRVNKKIKKHLKEHPDGIIEEALPHSFTPGELEFSNHILDDHPELVASLYTVAVDYYNMYEKWMQLSKDFVLEENDFLP